MFFYNTQNYDNFYISGYISDIGFVEYLHYQSKMIVLLDLNGIKSKNISKVFTTNRPVNI